jgi:hypothetical protein
MKWKQKGQEYVNRGRGRGLQGKGKMNPKEEGEET